MARQTGVLPGLPTRGGITDEPPQLWLEKVYGPDAIIAGIGIPPQDVGFPIGVEVTYAIYVPRMVLVLPIRRHLCWLK